MKKKNKDRWPGPYLKPRHKKNRREIEDGEAETHPLQRSVNDRSLHASEWQVCCGCGMRHLFVYEVFLAPKGNYWMNVRSFADERTRPKK